MIRRITIAFSFLLVMGIQQANSQVLIGLLFGEALNRGPIEFGLNIIGNNSYTTIDNGSIRRNKLGFGLYMDYKFSDNFF